MKQFNFTRDPEKKGDAAISVDRMRKRKLDLAPRLVCLVIAAFIWIYMVNLNDTDVTSTVTLRLEVVGQDELKDDSNMLIYGMDTKTVTVTVKGSNRDLRKYTEADYKATVDVSDLDKSGRHTLPIRITTPAGSSITVAGGENKSVNLYCDESLTKSVRFEVLDGDMVTVPAYNYEIVQSAYYVDIVGPREAVTNIDSAQYHIEGEFSYSKSFSGFSLLFCDKNGDYISFEEGILSYSTSGLTVKVNVTTQKSLPVVVEVAGMGRDLLAVPEKNYVTVYGDPRLLTQINEYTIHLSEAILGRDSEVTLSNDSFPEGVTVEGVGESFKITFLRPDN